MIFLLNELQIKASKIIIQISVYNIPYYAYLIPIVIFLWKNRQIFRENIVYLSKFMYTSPML